MIYTFYYTDWRWLFQFCGKIIYDSSQCAYLNRRSFSSFRSGDLVILTFLSTGTSDSRRSERYQPFNCISWMVLFTKSASKWPKLPTGTRLFLWNRDRKRCLHIPTSICPWSTWQLSSLAFSQLPLKCWKCCTICIY